ncbi:MAG: hypothetical protein DHS20C09_07960 [marine bacterium B5-7]|nr:MAG: hypothetical protein DHS20C09_07960 [marine bacterium B5-7]
MNTLKGMPYLIKSGVLTLLLFLPLLTVAVDNELEPVINSNKILLPNELSSPYHRVDSIEFSNGLYEFQVESDIGEFELKSLAVLKKRLNEIRVLSQAIEQYNNQNEDFSDELRSQLILSDDSAVDFLTSPIRTARDLAGQLGNNLDATLEGEDPFVRDRLNRYSLREPNDPTVARHKRNASFQLGLDMYSSNYKVQSFLNTVANARASGKVSAGVGLNSGFTTTQDKTEMDTKINYILKNKTLSDLNKYNVDLLLKLGINKKLIKAFIEHTVLSPTNKTTITTYLSGLEKVARLDSYIEVVLTADDEVVALIFEQLSKMLFRYYKEAEKFSAFYNFKGQAAVLTESRRIVFFEYSDLLIWSDENEKKYTQAAKHAMTSGYKGWEVVSLGSMSSLTEQQMDGLAFKHQASFLKSSGTR